MMTQLQVVGHLTKKAAPQKKTAAAVLVGLAAGAVKETKSSDQFVRPGMCGLELQDLIPVRPRRIAVRELGAERVIYGSDAAGRSFASQLGKVIGAVIPDPVKHLIFGENLRGSLLPVLKRKGIPA